MMDNRKYHCRDGLSLKEIEFRKGTIFDVIDPIQDGNDDPELKPCPLCGGKVMTMWDSIVCPHCKLTVEKQYTHDSPADIGSGVTESNLKKLWNERVGVKNDGV